MEGTKEADLITAVLIYAMRSLAEGDQTALRDMNFGIKEIEALREMRIADLYRIETLRAHCLDIHRETGLSMRAIWNQTQRWDRYGKLDGQIHREADQTVAHE